MENKLQITAKLTSKGKETFFLRGLQGVVVKFGLGDSDTNYISDKPLNEVYEYGTKGSDTVFDNVNIEDLVSVDVTGTSFKTFDNNDMVLSTKYISSPMKVDMIGAANKVENSDTTMFKMLKLPFLPNDKAKHIGTVTEPVTSGRAMYFKIDEFGELINGLDFKMSFGDIDIYSAFNSSITDYDATLSDFSPEVLNISNNTVLLFSDFVKPPRGDKEKSWATGCKSFKPYAKNNKSLFYFDEKDLTISDKMVGYVLLDRGIVVICDDQLIDAYSALATKEVSFDFTSEKLSIYQEYICQINRGEFTISKNPTYTSGDIVKVTEIGLFDRTNTLVAYAKLNKQLEITGIQPITVSIVFEI